MFQIFLCQKIKIKVIAPTDKHLSYLKYSLLWNTAFLNEAK